MTMDKTTKTDSELIEVFLGNDKEKSRNAFGVLYFRYQRSLIDWLYRKTKNEEEVKDCSQKVWLKLVEKLKMNTAVPDERGSIGGLLVKMAKDEMADYFRRKGRVTMESLVILNTEGEIVEKDLVDNSAETRAWTIRRELVSIINKALEYFIKKDRKIFWGIIRGESAEEISRQTGYTETTIKKKFFIQKMRVRTYLAINGYSVDNLY